MESSQPKRRFPPPWRVEKDGEDCFRVVDDNGISLASVYSNFSSRPLYPHAASAPCARERRLICVRSSGFFAMNFFRIVSGIFRASVELGRAPKFDEWIQYEYRQVEKSERRMFHRTIANLVIAWAQVEVTLDYSNLFLITNFETKEMDLPVSLKAKIAFFRKYFRVPELESYSERAVGIADKINSLKETRHDIVHGHAEKLTPEGLRRFIRFDYKGRELVERPKDYTLNQIITASEEITDLAVSMVAFLREVVETNRGEKIDDSAS
jgi:hypothetical protein